MRSTIRPSRVLLFFSFCAHLASSCGGSPEGPGPSSDAGPPPLADGGGTPIDGGGPGPDVGMAPRMVEKEVGPAGGTLTLGAVSLRVPAGALSSATTIRIEEIEHHTGEIKKGAPVVRLSPSYVSFSEPAQLTFTFTGQPANPLIYRAEDERSPFAIVEATAEAGRISAEISGFSLYLFGVAGKYAPAFFLPGSGLLDGPVAYTDSPSTLGHIVGPGVSVQDQLYTDGDGQHGRVWYGNNLCMSIRLGGTGVFDELGGRNSRGAPVVSYRRKVGLPTTYVPAFEADKILDPNFIRADKLVPFRWGLRLASGEAVYRDKDGFYEGAMRGDGDKALSACGRFKYDPVGQRILCGIAWTTEFTLTPPAAHHHCYFRQETTLPASLEPTCRSSQVANTSPVLTVSACYRRGMLDGPFSVKNGERQVVGGEYSAGRRTGGWSYHRINEPKLVAQGNYRDDLEAGVWTYRDTLNPGAWITEEVTYDGVRRENVLGEYRVERSGSYQKWWAEGSRYTRDGVSTTLMSPQLMATGKFMNDLESGWFDNFSAAGKIKLHQLFSEPPKVTGQRCRPPSMPGGQQICVPDLAAWLEKERIWGDCNNREIVTHITYDREGRVISRTCTDFSLNPISCGSGTGACPQ